MIISLLSSVYVSTLQTYLVTGGMNGNDYLASTEVLTDTGDSWITAGSLPSPLTGLRGLNLNNKIFMTGSGTD